MKKTKKVEAFHKITTIYYKDVEEDEKIWDKYDDAWTHWQYVCGNAIDNHKIFIIVWEIVFREGKDEPWRWGTVERVDFDLQRKARRKSMEKEAKENAKRVD